MMLKDAGATTVMLGHSERRRYHQETNAMVAAKARAARHSGLSTIVCIGETLAERRGGQALSVCGEQIVRSLPDEVARSGTTVIAYEPLWAIGTGRGPTSVEIAEVHLHIRTCLTVRAGAKGAEIHILKGGSVTSDTGLGLVRLWPPRRALARLLDGAGLADDHTGVPTRAAIMHSEKLASDDDRGGIPRQ